MNQHDDWLAFRNANRDALRSTGLPERVWNSRERLFQLLAYGAIEGEAQLSSLTNEQLLQIQMLVDVFHPDSQDAYFPALLQEQYRRSI